MATADRPVCTFYCDPTSVFSVTVFGAGFVAGAGECEDTHVFCASFQFCSQSRLYLGDLVRGFCILFEGDVAICKTELLPPLADA